jgi:cytochrome b6-f complex iron-sulfur subunit
MADLNSRPSRRSFLGKLWFLLGGVALAEAFWLAGDFLRPRNRRTRKGKASSLVVAGPVDRFEEGTVTAFREGRFYLARLEDGGFLALHRECTHLGCTVPWRQDEGRFICPCHASSFDIHGDVLSAPAPRPLDLFAVRIENGIVKVDTSAPRKRSVFSPNQVVRP